MRDITKLNIRYIDDNGRYTDYKRRLFMRLTDEEIIELRRYNHNRLIAKNRVRTKTSSQKVNVYNEDILREKVRLHTHKKKRKITKKWLKRNARALIIRGVLGITLAGGIIGAAKGISSRVDKKDNVAYEANVLNNDVYADELEKDDQAVFFEDILNKEQQRSLLIKRYCDIYQVDYNITRDLLVKLTNNFTTEDYYEGRIPGIVCKGVNVQAQSEEELIAYAIRNIKQIPEQFNLDRDKLYINNGYTSNNDYFAQIKYYANLFGVDECLVAAIVQSETGFDSHLFNSINNPAGLRMDGGWWEFANKEEGFIELCLELIKDYRIIGCPKDEVNEDIIRAIGNIHAPLSDGNDYWVPNVITSYEKYNNNYDEYFGNREKSNIKSI